jgi:hypothetical protein
MKNLLLITCLIITASTAWSQKAPRIPSLSELIPTAKPALDVEHQKDGSITIWSDDFSDETTWNIDNSGQQTIDYGWNINDVSDGWYLTGGISSTSGGNYAELVNGDPFAETQALDVVYTLTTAEPIDVISLAGTNQVTLEFEQTGARFNDLQQISISTDGVVFTPVGNNDDIEVLSSTGGSAYDNPALKQINLGTVLSETSAPIWIQFSWTTNFPAAAENPNVWVTYGWYIDDVRLVTNPGNDLVILDTYWGTEGLNYYQIPLTQVAPIDFQVELFNGGVTEQTNVILNADVNQGLFTGVSDAVALGSLDTATVTLNTQFTPDAEGTFSVVQSVTADSADNVPANNQIEDITFSVGDYIYARDNDDVGGSTTNGTDGFEAGNLFDVWADQTIKAIDIRIPGGTNGATIGTEFYVKLYSLDAETGDFIYVNESDVQILTTAMLNVNLTVDLLFPTELFANTTYLAVAGAYSEGFRVSSAGSSTPQTSFFLDLADNTWYYQTSTPYVRLNFDPTIGLEENSNDFKAGGLFPNPVLDQASLKVYLNNTQEITLNITDLSGRVVYNEIKVLNEGENELNIDATILNSGIYTVNLFGSSNTISKKMVVK